MKPEPTQKGNPHHLVVRQHVFPVASLDRFSNKDGRLHVRLITSKKYLHLESSHSLFCAERAWDERAEKGYMRGIEDEFQDLAREVIFSRQGSLDENTSLVATRFFALWKCRAHFKKDPLPDVKLNALGVERELTKDEEECLEKNGYVFARSNLTIAGRQMTGIQIQTHIDRICDHLESYQWMIVRADAGEFIVPDSPPEEPFIPLNPQIALVGNSKLSKISKIALGKINKHLHSSCHRYYLGRDLQVCPIAPK
ncbi:DUF4238 domain-containing protein [Geothrix sp. 21YS21S-4]|uniref:DUF4238 domain-containing protein n=1 Tax=Geothrix sp. 21YS21S-4 TaxID=3068889 RepID=UPI0027B9803A|nr:DUF4238 domain-containing protein [Geothrix sp. 21YS21S-4]